MDRERLGRVLGRGARLAARTAYEAVDAATSPGPVPAKQRTSVPEQRRTPVSPEVIPPRQRPVPSPDLLRAAAAAQQSVAAARQGFEGAKQGVAAPLKRASKALWHELTGCFFALFAFSFSAAVWTTRANAMSPVANTRYRFYAFCGLAVLFLYFSVSSFVRARRVT